MFIPYPLTTLHAKSCSGHGLQMFFLGDFISQHFYKPLKRFYPMILKKWVSLPLKKKLVGTLVVVTDAFFASKQKHFTYFILFLARI